MPMRHHHDAGVELSHAVWQEGAAQTGAEGWAAAGVFIGAMDQPPGRRAWSSASVKGVARDDVAARIF